MNADEIVGLGYLGVRTSSLEDWRSFGAGLLGMQALPLASGVLALRMDAAAHRVAVREGRAEGADYYGWEVKGPDSLQSLGARLEANGRAVSAMSASLRAEREVKDGFLTFDPIGNALEFFYGLEQAATAFEPGRPIMGFRTGALGMGHAVLNVACWASGSLIMRCDRSKPISFTPAPVITAWR
jgi:hypothetical protein